MSLAIPKPLLSAFLWLLPIGAIAGARFLTHTAWAADNAGWAAFLFAWVVADALLLALLAKAPQHKPELFQMVGVVVLAIIVILAGAAAPVRTVYFGLPELLMAAAATGIIFAIWSGIRIGQTIYTTRSVTAGFEQVLPKPLVKHIGAELRVLDLGLLRWGKPADVPEGTQAFSYHTFLTPMIATFVALQLIELSVVHLLLMLWNPTVAWVMLALSLWGIVWTIALLKSFRINPVLITDKSIRLRSGMIYDFEAPIIGIASCDEAFSANELESKAVLNFAIMSSPNVSLRFAQPVTVDTFFGGQKQVYGVALRLDDSEAFRAEFLRRLAQT